MVGQAQSVIAFASALLSGPAEALRTLSHLRENPTEVSVHDLGSLACRGILRGLSGQLHGALGDLTVVSRRKTPGVARRNDFGAVIHAVAARMLLGELTEAHRMLSLALDEAQTMGRETDFAVLHSISASLAALQGRWSTAQEDLAEVRSIEAASDFSGPYFHLVQSASTVAFARQEWHAVVDPLARVLHSKPTGDAPGSTRSGPSHSWEWPLPGWGGRRRRGRRGQAGPAGVPQRAHGGLHRLGARERQCSAP